MSDAHHNDAAHGHGHDAAEIHFSYNTYVIGFLLSVVLTAIPFWIVMTDALNPVEATTVIVTFAVLQILVHTVCFLHVNTRVEGGWTLMAYAFTAVVLLIMIAGSLWIMYHLNANMMSVPEMGDHL